VDAAGTGPEYDYPTTEKDEPIPVVKDGEEVPLGGEGTEPVVGEDDRELTDAEIAGTTEKFFTLKYMTHELCCGPAYETTSTTERIYNTAGCEFFFLENNLLTDKFFT